MLRRPLPIALLIAILLAVSPARAVDTLVVVVRHAEKAAEGDDPPLTEAGVARAERLARHLAGLRLGAVYATDYRRTRDTALPAARAAGIAVEGYAPDGAALAAAIGQRHRGEAVLVVGHSNTVPGLVALLGRREVAPIGDAEYDRLYLIALPENGEPRVLEARY
ncbi:SixA phosphatase family protein [Rehaibacterium terrae]|jgi:broad specificity phosphatase PhoE|uniref:Broad specificity phosphatase PhoE n=1 Tax=Rehaibacterium terrae TaxID=1341696 RepID=A0A7W8DD19_9GAMM|nr:histidine phosphatase family protein [Rehaibacterium terrae]MBB5014866.1 broad specificity phosphatase PhoE [Rehaibacterium terrae]